MSRRATSEEGVRSMAKKNIGTNVFVYPMPVVLVGTLVDDRPNFMAVGWISRVNYQPPLLGICIAKTHHTTRGIQDTGTFSVNTPHRKMVEVTDYCGLVSGKTIDKSKIFEVFYGELTNAPMIVDCPLNIECRVTQTVELPTNNLFIAEIAAGYAEERYLTDDIPDIRKMEPFVLSMPDNGYWAVGEKVAKAWKAGKKLKRRGV
jgi:flavin reductase (DIM6/NTAB) family NADH-FMN oxidoreductase RutF